MKGIPDNCFVHRVPGPKDQCHVVWEVWSYETGKRLGTVVPAYTGYSSRASYKKNMAEERSWFYQDDVLAHYWCSHTSAKDLRKFLKLRARAGFPEKEIVEIYPEFVSAIKTSGYGSSGWKFWRDQLYPLITGEELVMAEEPCSDHPEEESPEPKETSVFGRFFNRLKKAV